LEDFELEGVCQLPDHSPPRDGVPKAEEASWEQFGLGSRKRLLSAKDEAECGAKRLCDGLSEDSGASRPEEGSPRWSVPPLLSMGDDEVFVSGETGFEPMCHLPALGQCLARGICSLAGPGLACVAHGAALTCGISLGSTPPPGCAVRSCLSASGLQALTHSPLLFQGRTPSSQGKDTRGNLPVK
jgi:hypothetical protein